MYTARPGATGLLLLLLVLRAAGEAGGEDRNGEKGPMVTEAQDVERAEPSKPSGSDEAAHQSRRVEMEGRSWTIVDLEDGLSWNVYRQDDADRGPAPRFAHITISERGYFSTDAAGVVRGPYTTLDEAVYPLALGDRVLLDDPTDLTAVHEPVPTDVVPAPPRSRFRRRALVALALVGVAALAWRMGARNPRRLTDLRVMVDPVPIRSRALRRVRVPGPVASRSR